MNKSHEPEPGVTVTIEEIQRIATLARVRLEQGEAKRMARDMSSILEHMAVLGGVAPEPAPTSGVPQGEGSTRAFGEASDEERPTGGRGCGDAGSARAAARTHRSRLAGWSLRSPPASRCGGRTRRTGELAVKVNAGGVAERAAEVRDGSLAWGSMAAQALEAHGTWERGAVPLNAFIAVDANADRQRGPRDGPLAGIPVAVKDNLATADFPTTCGSRILQGVPFPVRSHRRPAASRGGRGHRRQDQHG